MKFATLVLSMAALLAPSISSAQLIEPLLFEGDEAPGTSLTFKSLNRPWLTETGLIVFTASLSDNTKGVWMIADGELLEVIRGGQPIPGAPNETASSLMNLVGIDGDNFAIFTETVGGHCLLLGDRASLSAVACYNMPAPGTNLLFKNINNFGLNSAPSIVLQNSTVVFTALVTDSLGTEASNGVWMSSGGTPTLVAIADYDPFDEVDEWPDVSGQVYDIRNVRMAESGAVYFEARARDPESRYLMRWSGGRSMIDIGTGNYPTLYSLGLDERLAVLTTNGSQQDLILETAAGSGSFTTIARVGDPATDFDGNPTLEGTFERIGSQGLAFDDAGILHVDAGVDTHYSTNAMWVYGADQVFRLDVPGQFLEGSPYVDPTVIAMNRAGDMIFAEDYGVWFRPAGESLINILNENQYLTIGPDDERRIGSFAIGTTRMNSPGYGGLATPLTPDAQVVMLILFDNADNGYFKLSGLEGGMVVNSTGDGDDLNPGDGTCTTGDVVGDVAECTLRAAIQEANATDEDETITFAIAGDPPYAISVTDPLPDVTDTITLSAPSYTDLPAVMLDGGIANDAFPGLRFTTGASGSTIKNMWIMAFANAGLELHGDEYNIVDNFLGLDGSQVTGNAVGLQLTGDASTISGNVISGNSGFGIDVTGNDHRIISNVVGLDRAGTIDVGNGASGIRIAGDTNLIENNLVSRNSRNGVLIASGDGNELYANKIGTAMNGRDRLGNLDHGIVVASGTGTVIGNINEGNTVSGNLGSGIVLEQSSTGTLILANNIGADSNGDDGPFNIESGIFIDGSSNNEIGSISMDTGNIIRDNEIGVTVTGSGVRNTIRYNKIFGNKTLDIDLAADAKPTANDLGRTRQESDQDTGPNDLYNFPVGVTLGRATNGDIVATGILETATPTEATIDVYGSVNPSATGIGGAEVHLGTATPDSTGLFRLVLPTWPDEAFLTATATSADGSTSEFSPVCTDPDGDGKADSDDDGLCDVWETDGIDYDMDGTPDLVFAAPHAADPMQKDIFIEVDWMKAADGHSHEPQQAGLDMVAAAFAQSPVENPGEKTGIKFHAIKGEAVREITPIGMIDQFLQVTAAGTFNDIKYGSPINPCGAGTTDGKLGTPAERASDNCRAALGARRLAMRYAIYGHDHAHWVGSSGYAELPGNDFLVTLGSWSRRGVLLTAGYAEDATQQLPRALAAVEAGTLMHEFGHTLNLKHGGNDHSNCKPNYVSVMNYTLQFPYLLPSRSLDYSTKQLASLNEASLSENTGLGGNSKQHFVFNRGTTVATSSAKLGKWTAHIPFVDWDGDGETNTTSTVQVDLDFLPDAGCPSDSTFKILEGFDDWSNLSYDFRSHASYSDGSRPAPLAFTPENTVEQTVVSAMNFDFDEDGIVNGLDNCAAIANPGQEDTDFDGVGDICEEGAADLSLFGGTFSRTENASAADQLTLFRLAVHNAGPDTVRTVALTDTLFAEADLTNVEATLGSCTTSGATLSCVADEMAPGDSMIVRFYATLNNLDQLRHTASVSGDALDTNYDNNRVDAVFTVDAEQSAVPSQFRLYQNYPNPFGDVTRIAFDLPANGDVRIKIFDVLGRERMVVANDTFRAGHNVVTVKTDHLPAGVYFYSVRADGIVATRQMVRIR